MPGTDRTGRRVPAARRAPPLVVASPRATALAILGVAPGPETAARPAPAERVEVPSAERVELPRADGLIGFQAEAVDRAEAFLARRGGVLIADGVGMGKTRMGAALALAAARGGGRVLLVVPAGLRRQWRAELCAQGGAPAGCVVVSHARLSRDGDPEEGGPPFDRIVVDEAHAFRNPRTRRYVALARLARAAQVVLLSATPVNNSLLDLYFLIRLFAGDGAFADVGVPDLNRTFKLAALAPDAPPPPALAAVLGTVLIRRTRAAAVGLTGRGLRFPERAAPAVVRYDLTGVYRDAFDDAVAAIDALRLAPYRLGAYGVAGGGSPAGSRPGTGSRAGAAELLRLLLAKRLESGQAAFLASVQQLTDQLAAFRDALDRGLLRRPSDRVRGNGAGLDQLVFEELLLARLPPGLDAALLRADTDADLTILRKLASLNARAEGTSPDPKVDALRRLLFAELRAEKVVVFTEFRDTAVHLWRALRDAGGVALIHGSQAFLGAAQAGRAEVVRRFAPRANGVREPPPREAVRVLIATDVLSEGLNLQDAAHVVSFDLPWNPVRLIQRIGRVDRLGSLHDTVHAHHFLPDAGLERLLGLVERLRRKLAAIRAGLGGQTDAWPADGAADPDTRGIVERLAAGDPTLLDALEAADAGAFGAGDPLAEVRDEVASLGAPRSLAVATGHATAAGADAPRSRGGHSLVGALRTDGAQISVVALELEYGSVTLEVDGAGRVRPAGAAAANALRAALADDRCAPLSIAERRATRSDLRVALSFARGRTFRPRLAARSVPAVALQRLRARAAALPGGPDAALCARIDRIARDLARGLRAGRETTLQELLDRGEGAGPVEAELPCGRLEALLAEWQVGAGEGEEAPTEPRVVAILRVNGRAEGRVQATEPV
jgi:Helicase conserved C-terminal domain/SNF2-related domain